MAVRSFDSPDRRVPGALTIAHPAERHALRHRLVVVAPCTVAAVRFAGGFLFDRVMAGWEAIVLVADQPDSRPLRILGARTTDLETAFSAPPSGRRPQAIAVEAGLYGADGRIRRVVREALDEGTTEVRVWGDGWPADLDGSGGPVQHRLSVAARAFKAQALAAAAAPADPVEVTETFRGGEPPRLARTPHLTPVS